MPAPKGHPPYNTNGEGGRPVKYTTEFIEKEAEEFLKWMKLPDSIYFKRFAFDRGYSYQRMVEFAASNKRFSDVLDQAREWQEIRLAEGGLTNEFNGNFCKFVMGNTCGWTDKQQISGDSSNPLSCLIQKVDGKSKELVDG